MSLLSNARRSLLSSVNGLPISSMVLARLLTALSNAFCTCLAFSRCRGSNLSLLPVDASSSPTYFSHLRPQSHPAPQSSRVLSEAYCPSIIFHCSIVLVVALVNGNRGESVCCLLDHARHFLSETLRKLWDERSHIPQMNRDPSGINCVAQRK